MEKDKKSDCIINVNKYVYFDKEYGRFYLTNEASEMLYRKKNIICSYSGCNEWINDFTIEMINLYSGSSPYNHCLDCCDHHKVIPQIFEEDPDKVYDWIKKTVTSNWGKHMYKMIENIIDDIPVCE